MKAVLMLGPNDGEVLEIGHFNPYILVPIFEVSVVIDTYDYIPFKKVARYTAYKYNAERILEMWYDETS